MFMSNQLQLPPGFRFHPTDEELMMHYLCRKWAAQPIAVPVIAEIDLYKFDPWQLPGMALYGEKEWYFFSPRDRKYPNGSRPNRAAGTGYWKATGADKPIGRPKTVGIKKALVFYAGKAPRGEKTNWIMHEYRLANVDRSARKANNFSRLDDWVLCRIYNKKGTIEKHPAIDRRLMKYPEDEDRKPQILLGYNDANAMPAQTMMVNQLQQLEAPWLHTTRTDSIGSASEQVGWQPPENEVQSEPKWNDLEEALDFQFNYMDGDDDDAFPSDPFASFQLQFQQNPLQQHQEDMLMYINKPFY